MRMRRISIKRYIRGIAIAMIAIPEPVSTFLGIAILSASFVIWTENSLKKFGNLEGLVKKSFKYEELPMGFRRHLVENQKTVMHTLKSDFLQSEHFSEKPNALPFTSQYHSWFDNHRVSDKTIYHTLKTSFPQYEANLDCKQNGKYSDDKVVHYK
jgi:hypothetical protein